MGRGGCFFGSPNIFTNSCSERTVRSGAEERRMLARILASSSLPGCQRPAARTDPLPGDTK